jgi:hypothetical protein
VQFFYYILNENRHFRVDSFHPKKPHFWNNIFTYRVDFAKGKAKTHFQILFRFLAHDITFALSPLESCVHMNRLVTLNSGVIYVFYFFLLDILLKIKVEIDVGFNITRSLQNVKEVFKFFLIEQKKFYILWAK